MTTRKAAGTKRSMRNKIQKLDSGTSDEPRSYNKPLLESILDLLSEGRFSDVSFIVGDRKEQIPCHQLFLKARSPVFEVMFSERWNQDTAKEVTLEDVDPETFRKFLQFIYTDTLDANMPETLELLELAHKYDVQLLVSKCEELLQSQVTLDDTIAVFQTARKYDKIQLMDKVGEMWAESLTKLQTLPSFTELDKGSLMYILKRNDLKIKEVDLFRLTLQWAGNQADATVDESLKDILPLIRFPTMTANEFTTAVVPTKLLSDSTVIELFVYFGNNEDAKKSLAPALGFSTQERKPKDTIVYKTLYPEDRALLRTHTHFRNLKECVQFHSKSQGHSSALVPAPATPAMLGFGLSGINIICPAKAATNSLSGRALGPFKAFNICVKAKVCRDMDSDWDSYEMYTELLSLRSVQVEEGNKQNIDFGTVVTLNKDTIYFVTIEEVESAERGAYYFANDFGNQKNSIAVSFKNIGWTTFNLRRNQLRGFTQDPYNYNNAPCLICKLGFQAL